MKKTEPVNIEGQHIQYAKEAKILGLKLGVNGYTKHVKDITNKAQVALNTIKRFQFLNTNIKLHLVKACVLPILTYPAYALNALSNSQILKLQRKQNEALRFAYNEKHPFTKNTEELHKLAQLDPINITVHTRGNYIKHKMIYTLKDTTYHITINEHEQEQEHSWFRKPINKISKLPPRPLYTG